MNSSTNATHNRPTTATGGKKRKITNVEGIPVEDMPKRHLTWFYYIKQAFTFLWLATKKRPILTPLFLVAVCLLVAFGTLEVLTKFINFLINLTQ